ncbi:MAG TPA: P-loop NTPase, partial [Caulobacteraceae bacterium]|nr:P-loop NTPase [Caulobacteraceae bacterium]
MSQSVERSAVIQALNAIRDPRSGKGLVEAGLVQGLVARDGRVGFMLEVAPGDVELYEPVRGEAEAVLKALPGVERAQVVLTADRAAGPGAQSGEPPVPPGTVRMRRNARLSDDAQAQVAPPEQRPPPGLKPAHVSHVIAVASGKGGVGKSTVAVNLAAALAMLGRRTGLLDADVYGPSVPRMTGLEDEPEVTAERKLKPLEGWGLKVMSIGLLVDEASPMIWRGP